MQNNRIAAFSTLELRMTTIAQVAAAMQTILSTTADAAAHRPRFVQRPRRAKLTGSTFAQTLVFGWLADPDASLDSLAQTAAAVGAPHTHQAIILNAGTFTNNWYVLGLVLRVFMRPLRSKHRIMAASSAG
jgi:hypothetical protein